MTLYYQFRSETDPELRGITEDPSGDRLPAENSPWILLGQISSDDWTIPDPHAAVAAGVALNGFFLCDKAQTGESASSNPIIESDRVEGTAVFDLAGTPIGTIERLLIEKVSGRVLYADVVFGGFLGLGTHHHTIPWEKLAYDISVGGYRTDVTEEQLKNAPGRAGEGDWSDRERRLRGFWG